MAGGFDALYKSRKGKSGRGSKRVRPKAG